jgi:hypothetical protein
VDAFSRLAITEDASSSLAAKGPGLQSIPAGGVGTSKE